MCGILACFHDAGDPKTFRARMVELGKRLRHRGPDWTGVEIFNNNAFIHERLAIVDVESGDQPLKSQCENSKCMVIVNGEIYNHKRLRQDLQKEHVFATKSDSEILLHLYEDFGCEMPKYLDGDFAFVLYDGEHYIAGRDPIGVVPLYQGWGDDGSVWFASEMKCLVESCSRIVTFPPGHYYSSRTGTYVQYYNPPWYNADIIPRQEAKLEDLRKALERSVEKRLMCDSIVPYGVLLSGGLDSSLIASIMARFIRNNNKQRKLMEYSNGDSKQNSKSSSVLDKELGEILHSFAIGLPGSPDLKAAKEVADFLGTIHHEFHYTIEEGIDVLPDVIQHLETYDKVRAGIPMYLLARRIKALGIKMVLSGEGSDEVFAGYLYFHRAPNDVELHKECVSRLKNLHVAECLRANKSPMAWGLEIRVPFLDRDFLDVAMQVNPAEKLSITGKVMEKNLLRKAFDDPKDPYLPTNILWRRKEQFSDGVGYSWIDSLKEYANAQVSDEEFAQAAQVFPQDPPATKETFFYRTVFERYFPNKACQTTVKRWIPRLDWGCVADSSGRAQQAHHA